MPDATFLATLQRPRNAAVAAFLALGLTAFALLLTSPEPAPLSLSTRSVLCLYTTAATLSCAVLTLYI